MGLKTACPATPARGGGSMKKSPRILALAFAGALSTFASGCGDERFDTLPADEAPTDSTSEALACSTRVTYGDRWIRPSTHPAQYDIAGDLVTWNGVCVNEGTNSYAVLSNGWKPYFTGNN